MVALLNGWPGYVVLCYYYHDDDELKIIIMINGQIVYCVYDVRASLYIHQKYIAQFAIQQRCVAAAAAVRFARI